MKIEIEVAVYEIDGKECAYPAPSVIVRSHWNRDNMIILEMGDCNFTIAEDDIIKAIKRCVGWKY